MKVLVKYVREPVPNLGYFNFEKLAKVLAGKGVDKNGGIIDPIMYVKSTINYFKTACLVAVKDDDGEVLVGYSQWNQKLDEYDPEQLFDVAISRAFAFKDKGKLTKDICIPSKVAKELPEFLVRVTKYFKDAKLAPWVNDLAEIVAPKRLLEWVQVASTAK